ncbi:MAG: protein kinase family protein, partial [Verrucomicrobia bacterium]|nr:protein kinase family protein [Verrucomicrobiota bacterium]
MTASSVKHTHISQLPQYTGKLVHKKQKIEALSATAAKWVDASKFKSQIKKYGYNALQKTIGSCEKIWKLQGDLGLKEKELYKIALYINTKMKGKIKEGNNYLRKKETGLARTIEYDPKSKRTFIHLKIPLGTGVHKIVEKSLMYDPKRPQFVATTSTTEECANEVAVHKKVRNMKGLVHTYAVTKHVKEKSQKTVTSMMLELYNAKSLRHYQYSRGELTPTEELTIARDLLYGLENMHSKNLVHRDLHSGNYLVNRTKENVSAALIDFGRAKSVKEAAKTPTFTPAKRLNPPEMFRKTKSLKHKALDIYALGIELFHLHFGTEPSLPS